MRTKVFNWITDQSACMTYRCVNPTIQCRDELAKDDIILDMDATVHLDIGKQGYTHFIGHRIPHPKRLPFLLKLKTEHNIKLIWEVDDDLASVPDWSPFKVNFDDDMICFLDMFFQVSDYIIVSTDHLKVAVIDKHKMDPAKIIVLKNLIDVKDYNPFIRFGFPQVSFRTPFQVMWSGSESHVKDLDELGDMVYRFRGNKEIFFCFHGWFPPKYRTYYPDTVLHVPWNTVKHYPGTICRLWPHVGLLPLAPHYFNNSKSNIKLLEMSMAGAACISSDIMTYANDIVHGETGFIAKNMDDWYDYVEALFRDPVLRRRMSDKALEYVIENWSWQTNNANRRAWLDFYRMLANC